MASGNMEAVAEVREPAPISANEVADFERAMFAWVRACGNEVKPHIHNHFAPGIYMREMAVPAGTLIVGHKHKTEHFNILLSGVIRVVTGGTVMDITGPAIIRSQAGDQKIGCAVTDVRWLTVHATEETDVAKLEESLVEKSEAFLEHQAAKELTS